MLEIIGLLACWFLLFPLLWRWTQKDGAAAEEQEQ